MHAANQPPPSEQPASASASAFPSAATATTASADTSTAGTAASAVATNQAPNPILPERRPASFVPVAAAAKNSVSAALSSPPDVKTAAPQPLASVPSDFDSEKRWDALLDPHLQACKMKWAGRTELFDPSDKRNLRLPGVSPKDGRQYWGHSHVHISHSMLDSVLARAIYSSLLDVGQDGRHAGARLFYPHRQAEWPTRAELRSEIMGVDVIVYVMSLDAVMGTSSDAADVRWEVAQAVELKKRVIPIRISPEIEKKHLPREIASLRWFDLLPDPTNGTVDPQVWMRALDAIANRADADYYHVRFHTQLLLRTYQWEADLNARQKDAKKPVPKLLNRTDCEFARRFRDRCAIGYEPNLNELQLEYINASERDACVIM